MAGGIPVKLSVFTFLKSSIMTTLKKQRYLKTKGTIALITVMNMIVPLSLDMYLPAVPQMSQLFNTSETMVNFTLVGFFFFMAIGILIFGPFSDKYGRKKPLIAGTFIYMLASAACAIAFSIEFLIIARIVQSIGAGCMMAVSTALIKDCFETKTRGTVLAVVQAMGVIGPMLAPVIGAWIITLFSWRTTFWLLTILAGICLLAVIALQETLPKKDRTTGHILTTMSGLITVGKNKAFTSFLMVNVVLTAPYMAYIAVCSYIYIDFFSLSETTYSYYFAINSAAAILGPIVYIMIKEKIKAKLFMTTCIIACLGSGLLVLTLGMIGPLIFLLCFLPFTIFESALRPFSTSVLLNQQERDTGSASSLINFSHTLVGSLGMILGALNWNSYIGGLGILITGFAVVAMLGWIGIVKANLNLKFVVND